MIRRYGPLSSGLGPVVGVGGSGALPVLRRADERPDVGAVSVSRDLALVAVASATQPENQGDVGAHEVPDRPLDSSGPYLCHPYPLRRLGVIT